MCGIAEYFVKKDREGLTLGVRHFPAIIEFGDCVGGVHPVEWFVCTAVGMNGNAAIGLHHDETVRLWQC